MTLVFDKKNHLVGAAVYSDDGGSFIDMLTIIINQKLGAKELGGMIFSFPTPTYGLVAAIIPLFLKK
jgi:glutathione reductase (NADPH)